MADEVKTLVQAPGIVGDGTKTVDRSKLAVYRQTPKYADPHAPRASNKLARFYFPADLVKYINDAFKKELKSDSAPAQVSKSDEILKKLSGEGYIEFFLQSVNESFEERFQIVETLGDNYAVFGIGRKPRIFNFSGALFNSVENNWRVNFIYMFEQFLSISKLAKFGGSKVPNVVNLSYDSVVLQGAVLNLNTNLQASNELATGFSMSMLVTRFDPGKSFSLSSSTGSSDLGDSTAPGSTETTKGVFATSVDDQHIAINTAAFKRSRPV